MTRSAHRPPERLAPKLILLLAGMLLGGIVFSLAYRRAPAPGAPSRSEATAGEARSSDEFKLGREKAQTYCATCHLLPDPGILDKVNWGLEVLPAMGEWMGFRDYPFEQMELDQRVRDAKIVHEFPMFSVEEWRAICLYYLEMAPTQVPANARPPIHVGLKHFELFMPEKQMPAATTLVKIDPVSHFIYIGSATNNTLTILDPMAREVHSIKLDSPPVGIDIRQDGYYVTLIGSYLPSDKLQGALVFAGRPAAGADSHRVILRELPRPVDTHFVDLNGDGIEDILICGYGNLLGELCWYEGRGGDNYVKRVLQERPGAISAAVHDFNRDGKPDIAVMFAQAKEGIDLMWNKGNGQFEIQNIVSQHPAWGYAHLEMVDANGDGAMDLLACNGDNGDHTRHLPPFKPYHGIRLYLNDGKNNFQETWFHPLNGAYKTITRDFDLDGDLDIAAISFYVDYRNYPREGFLYLENKGGWNFETYTFEESLRGRWLTMDAGDLDGDGDLDIVLGALVDGPTLVPSMLHEKWREVTPPVFILRNTIRR